MREQRGYSLEFTIETSLTSMPLLTANGFTAIVINAQFSVVL